MATYTALVTTGTDDGNDQGTGTDYITAYYQRSLSDTEWIGFCKLDSAAISSLGTITGATLFWWNHSYTVSSKETYYREILIWNGSSYSSIYTSTATPGTLSWDSHALTSGELAYINNYNSNTQTLFHFEVGYPTQASGTRTWNVRAYEYGTPDGDYSPYLEIYYDPIVVERRQRIIII